MKAKVYWKAQEQWPARRPRGQTPLAGFVRTAGCLLIFAGLCALGYLAWSTDWRYGLVLLFVLLLTVTASRIRRRHDWHEHLAALEAAFLPKGCPVPRWEELNAYSFPFFTLTFPSKVDMQAAEDAGCIEVFKKYIQQRYSHLGSAANPFDAQRAVWATYEGWEERFIAKHS